MAYFQCTVCGYIHEGTKAPGQCLICKAPSSRFVLLDEETSMKISQESRNVESNDATKEYTRSSGRNDAEKIIQMYKLNGGKLQVVQWYREKYKVSLLDAKNRVDEVLDAEFDIINQNKYDMEQMKNERAFELLDEAMTVSRRVTQKEIENDHIDMDHMYPDNREDTERMQELINDARAAADDVNDPAFRERYTELNEIAAWSMKRHRTWLWQLIAGALIGAGFLYYLKSDNQETLDNKYADIAKVEKWTECDTTVAFDKCINYYDFKEEMDWHDATYTPRLNSANKYKLYLLAHEKLTVLSNKKNIEEYKKQLDTASTEKIKERIQKRMEESQKYITKHEAAYDSINALKYAQIKEGALEETKKWADQEQSYSNTLRNYTIYLLILIPLYIITGYPRGYTITRHRLRSKIMNIFRKVGFGIASIFFGVGFAMSLLPDYKETTVYSDGHRTTETKSDPGNAVIITLKVLLMIIGAVIFSLVSSIIMTVETISGLKENIDWKALFSKINKKSPKEIPC